MSGPENLPIQPPLTPHELEVREELCRNVDALAGLIGIRHDSRPSSLDATVAHITREWENQGQAVKVEAYHTAAWEAKNLVVEWRGQTQPDSVVIVGAHYDTVRGTPGADDNASAVAMLLAVSEALKNQRYARTVRFVAFANEEPPHFPGPTMGSAVYAKACKQRGDDIYAMVCLEMVGYYDTAPNSQTFPTELPKIVKPLLRSTGDFIAFVSDMATRRQLRQFTKGFKKAVKFPVISAPVPKARDLLWLSDHGPFWDQGYPALMVTDTSWFRNENYHEMSDTPDTLDYDRMSRVAVGVAEGVSRLAIPVRQ
ncbi:MAG: M28 family peptidase [Planctomycetota bacterium]